MKANQFISCPVCGQTPCNCTHIAEGLRDPKDNPCWKGYHPVGTKKKNGRTVPNCVPNATEGVAEGSDHSLKKVWDRYSKHLMAARGDHPDVRQINKSGAIVRNIRKYVKDHHGQQALDDMERYAEKQQWNEGVAEGFDDVKKIDPAELSGSTLGGIAGYMAGDALGGPMVGFGAAGVGSAVGGALAKEGIRKGVVEGSLDEISANPDYLRAAERSRSQAQATQRTFGKSPEEKAAARRTELKRDRGIAGYTKRHRVAHPEMYPKVQAQPAPKLRDPSTEYSDDYSVWAKGRRDTMEQGVAEAVGLYGPFTATINTGERPKSRTKTKKFRREDDAILWAQDWLENFPQYSFATAEVKDPDGNVVWTTDEEDSPWAPAKQDMAEDRPVDSDGYTVDREDAGEYDYEGDQAKDQLQTIVAAARKLNGMLDDNENMPEWVQMKITKATDYLDTAADYVAANKAQAEPMAEAEPEKIGGRHDPADFDDMVSRLKKLAGAGPMKTVYDPNNRRYRNVPTAQQPGDKK